MTRKNQDKKKRTLQIETLDNRVMLDGSGFLTPVFYGPTPYLSEADTPAGFVSDPDCDACVYGLETFEDNSIDLGIQLSQGMIIGPGFSTGTANLTDSVDGDDGVIDGTGQSNNLGYSYFSEMNSVTVTLPSLMQSAGLVWTDGAVELTDVIFEAFDENGDSLGTINAGPIANDDFMGSTDEDRFFGISYGDGITTGVTSIQISNVGGDGIEIDHIQFSNCSACCDIDLELEKSVDATIVSEGDTVNWTVTVTNNADNANADATGVVITDLIPAGLTFIGAAATSGSFDGVNWTLNNPLAPGASESLTVTTTIDGGLAGGTMLTNTAYVVTANETDVDSTPGDMDTAEDDADDAKVTIGSVIDLELNKTVDSTDVQTGDTVTWTVSLTNNALNGNAAATGVTVTDLVPTGLTVVSATPTSGNFAGDTWTLGGPLALGDTETLTVVTTINGGLAGGTMLTNTAYVATANETDIDSVPGDANLSEDDADDAKVTIASVIDLELNKTVDSSVVQDGDTVTWTVNVTNNAATGNTAATGVTINDVVPAGLNVVSVTPTNGTFAGDTWTLDGPLALGDSESLTVVTTVVDGLAGGTMIVNTAFVATANETDVDSTPGDATLTEDDADDAKITIGDIIDLELSKTVDSTVVQTGDTVNWTISLTNNSSTANADATGVVVQDLLPAGLDLVNATPSGDSQFAAGQWIINEAISPGETLTLGLETTVTTTLDGIIVNMAQVVDADQTDIDSTPNNSAGEDDEANAQIVVENPVSLLMLSGHAYVDTNNDGIFQSYELPLMGVEVTLMGTDNAGNAVNLTTFTDIDGFYKFNDLAPGTYMVTQTQPVQFLDGKDTVGNLGGDDSANDKFTVTLTGNAEEYNFGELGLLPEWVNKRLYLTSTPYTEWNYVDVRQSSIWYSFDVDHQSYLDMNAVMPAGGDATMTIFDSEMNIVGSETLGLIVDPVQLDGGTYYMQISGNTVIETLTMEIVSPNVSVNGDQLIAVGTAGDDNIFLYLGMQQHMLDINGLTYLFDASEISDIHIGSGHGNDSVTVVGTHLDDTASVLETCGEFSSSNYSVHTYSFDDTTYVSGGGNDHSQIYGSYGDDTLSALPDDTTLTTPDGTIQMLGFDRVDAYGRGGNDYAALYGTQDDDLYIAKDEFTVLTGDNFMAYTKGFERVDAFGRGGNDVAELHDSAGDDHVVSTAVFTSLQTPSRLTYTKDFEQISIKSLNGGNDTAHLINLGAADHIQASGSNATVTRDGNRTESINAFDHVLAHFDAMGSTDVDENIDFLLDIV